METNNFGLLLQEILKKLERFDTRLASVESQTQGQSNKDMSVNESKREVDDKYDQRGVYHADRLTRQTKVEFPILMEIECRIGFSKVKESLNWMKCQLH